MGENTPFTIMPISPEIAEILWSAAYLTIQTREPFSLFRTNGNLLNPNGEIVLESQG
jgi:GDP-D-mannose dehydratase